MNAAEIQYALDRRNFVSLTEDCTLEKPIQLGHLTGKVVIEGQTRTTITNTGETGRHFFEYKYISSYSHDPPEIYLEGFQTDEDNDVTHTGLFKVREAGTSPARLVVRDVRTTSSANYAIDCPSGGDIDCLIVEDCTFRGSGGVRWLLDSSSTNHFMHLTANHFGGGGLGRVGPSFNFKNCQNVTMRLNINELEPDLLSELQNVYAGPIGFRFINPRGRTFVDDFWFEPWGSWSSVAPDCFGFELRNDDVSGGYGQHIALISNAAFAAGGLTTGVELIQTYGGHSNANAGSLLTYFENHWKPGDTEFAFGGKQRVIFDRAFDNSDMDDDLEARVDGIISGSWRDPIWTPGSQFPFDGSTANEGNGVTYTTGGTLGSAWVDVQAEYDA